MVIEEEVIRYVAIDSKGDVVYLQINKYPNNQTLKKPVGFSEMKSATWNNKWQVENYVISKVNSLLHMEVLDIGDNIELPLSVKNINLVKRYIIE